MNLDKRKLQILAIVVERFIETGEPVSSKYVADIFDNTVSSATIRNDMAFLEGFGLLDHMHTSSGRVPTHQGYRIYINQMMKEVPLTATEKTNIDALFNVRNADPDRVLEDAAASLAEYTGMAAVSATMQHKDVTVKRIEIVPAGLHTLVIMLITSSGMVKNRVCRVDFNVTDQIVDFFIKFANSRLVGKSISEITTTYLNSVSVSLGEYAKLFMPVFAAIYELVKDVDEGQYVTKGMRNLLDFSELDNGNELLKFLEEKNALLELINDGNDTETRVYIGKENFAGQLSNSSVLISRYKIGENATGLLALVGPARMDYKKLFPRVEYFAKTLGKLLSTTYLEEIDDG